MIRSMTGFGKAECELKDKKVTVEIRCLNSRQLDMNIRIPSIYRERETALRNEISVRLGRGKIELSILSDQSGTENIPHINRDALKHYTDQLTVVAGELGIDKADRMEIMKLAVRMPEVLVSKKDEPDETEWQKVYSCIISAIDQADSFRLQEGAALQKDLENRIGIIEGLRSEIDRFEEDRINSVRKRLEKNLKDFFNSNTVDRNRFEQEIIFYIEKLDITEEKVRLKNHTGYFRETINDDEPPGKKLGFIAQEIGREINTIGSKANDHNIQKLVVRMKDELEKIREQTLNIL